jgi:hypothetical protein
VGESVNALEYATPRRWSRARWFLRYGTGVPIIAFLYSALMPIVVNIDLTRGGVRWDPLVDVLGFPLLYLTEIQPMGRFLEARLGGVADFYLVLGNSLIWAFGVSGAWHLASIILCRRRQ